MKNWNSQRKLFSISSWFANLKSKIYMSISQLESGDQNIRYTKKKHFFYMCTHHTLISYEYDAHRILLYFSVCVRGLFRDVFSFQIVNTFRLTYD